MRPQPCTCSPHAAPQIADGLESSTSLNLPPPRTPARSLQASVAPLVAGPPAGFDFRASIYGDTRSTVATQHPELVDLVDDGEKRSTACPLHRRFLRAACQAAIPACSSLIMDDCRLAHHLAASSWLR
jgi:hypothetical protein